MCKKKGHENQLWSTWPDGTISSDIYEKLSQIDIFEQKKKGHEDQFWSTWPDGTISSDIQEKLSQIDIFEQKKEVNT